MKTEILDQPDTTIASARHETEAFGSRWGYDTSYMSHVLEHHPEAYAAFAAFVPMASFRQHAPVDALFVAKLTAFRHHDCGGCLQLNVRMALDAGVPREVIRAALRGGNDLPDHLALASRFARAVLDNDVGLAGLRDDVQARFGIAATVELALAIAATGVFPTVKKALGFFHGCEIVRVED